MNLLSLNDRLRIFLILLFLLGILKDAAGFPVPADEMLRHTDLSRYRASDGRLEWIRTQADWEERRKGLKANFEMVAGSLPQRRPISLSDVRITEVTTHNESLRLTVRIPVRLAEPNAGNESLRRNDVPADLYIPEGISLQQKPGPGQSLAELKFIGSPRPAMLALHPTGKAGKRIVAGEGGRTNRQYGLECARRGYVVLAPDYPSFGDLEDDFSDPRFASGTIKGILNHLICTDVLEALSCTDGERMGVIGHSLGGHNAVFAAFYDDRLKTVITSCGWTPFPDYRQGNLTGWTSARYFPRIAAEYGKDPQRVPFDLTELIAALAPRRVISVSPLNDDNFDIGGVRRVSPGIERIFGLYSVPNNYTLLTPECEHDFPPQIRRQVYRELDRSLNFKARDIDPDYATQLPRIAALEPEEARLSFRIADGFAIRLAAAEPNIQDPVAMDFAADGRLYVVEMRGYSEQADDLLGRVRVLNDGDADGYYEESTVFAEGLSWPTAVCCWNEGVIVGAAPDILFLRDSDGDGIAEERRVLFTGFGRTNVQGLLNSFRWGPDNRIYGATSSSAGTVHCPSFPDRPPVNLRGQDFSFDPRTLDLRSETGGAQHGMSFDTWGRRFVCSNSDHAQAIIYDTRTISGRAVPDPAPGRISIAVEGGQAPVYRISPVEPWRLVRTHLRVNGLASGPVEGGGRAAGYFTGSTGITLYNGHAWDPFRHGQLFVADVGSNLVHRKRLTPAGSRWSAERMDAQTEFLASEDIWFRPVQLANGPDGCLYVLDMYREVIEHPKSLPTEIKRHLDLTSGRDRGRLYRITPVDWLPPEVSSLGEFSTTKLISLLNHPNGWQRITANRLLAERGDITAASAVRKMLSDAAGVGVLHGLSALHGLGLLADADILRATERNHPRILERAAWFARLMPSAGEPLLQRFVQLTQHQDARVRMEAALTLSHFSATDHAETLLRLYCRSDSDPWIRTAALSGIPLGELELLRVVTQPSSTGDAESSPPVSGCPPEALSILIQRLADGYSQPNFARLLNTVLPEGSNEELESQVLSALRRVCNDDQQLLLNDRLNKTRRRILAAVEKGTLTPSEQASLIGQLTFSDYAADGRFLMSLLHAGSPAEVRLAVLTVFESWSDPYIGILLLDKRVGLGPAECRRIDSMIRSRKDWLLQALHSAAEGTLSPEFFRAEELQEFLKDGDAAVRDSARELVAVLPPRPREEVIRQYLPAAVITGDPQRGEAVFRRVCAGCHRVNEIGHEVGPQLQAFISKGPEALIINLLDPNREVNPAWQDYIVVTRDGRIHHGVMTTETTDNVILLQAEGKTMTIPRTQIEELRATGRSLMPEELEKDLTHQQLADLISWLRKPILQKP